ncbi:hypothetical protein RFI_29805 [Reticulomyxa filosa]|uniref:Uncharacterized protein n=1 Tax=Reticulomyxa filosa TaxID=46433 RepID=X6M1U8_RETFI|nr:hypothetical protein RFI_29805 [Reticulomyxa filosa]|eukprot:ETO07586.1 hypothetical protein RFI_29805 [Reticulomyxa filosa]
MKKNKMTLFCKMKGLSIEHDEGNNTFEYHRLSVCDDIKNFHKYAYVCINDIILFFGGHYNKSGIYIIGGENNRYAKV